MWVYCGLFPKRETLCGVSAWQLQVALFEWSLQEVIDILFFHIMVIQFFIFVLGRVWLLSRNPWTALMSPGLLVDMLLSFKNFYNIPPYLCGTDWIILDFGVNLRYINTNWTLHCCHTRINIRLALFNLLWFHMKQKTFLSPAIAPIMLF